MTKKTKFLCITKQKEGKLENPSVYPNRDAKNKSNNTITVDVFKLISAILLHGFIFYCYEWNVAIKPKLTHKIKIDWKNDYEIR
jgi:hypothetical protein